MKRRNRVVQGQGNRKDPHRHKRSNEAGVSLCGFSVASGEAQCVRVVCPMSQVGMQAVCHGNSGCPIYLGLSSVGRLVAVHF
jgi:hypothetical protein